VALADRKYGENHESENGVNMAWAAKRQLYGIMQ
jgi:hypothetical protein